MDEFIQKVAAMRQAQRDYFKSRDPFNLKAAKKLEAEVDAEIKILTGDDGKDAQSQVSTDNHPKLFQI